jgi:hypothetical protein
MERVVGRGSARVRAPITLVRTPPSRLPAVVSSADDLWHGGRLLAECWRLDSTSEWEALRAVSAKVEEVVRLQPRTAAHAAARFLWLMSLELDDALLRSIGSESDGDPAQTERMRRALTSTVSAWRRLQQPDDSSVSAVLQDAVEQIEDLVELWR